MGRDGPVPEKISPAWRALRAGGGAAGSVYALKGSQYRREAGLRFRLDDPPPPGTNMLSALPLTLVDRSRDVDRAARCAPDPVARASRAASRSFATAAGTIERLPPLQYGEDRSTRSEPGGAQH
jgi:hypothetical protein